MQINNSKSSISENLTDVNENKNVVLAIRDSANALKTTLVKKYVYYNGYVECYRIFNYNSRANVYWWS